jgi:hypothetical protein
LLDLEKVEPDDDDSGGDDDNIVVGLQLTEVGPGAGCQLHQTTRNEPHSICQKLPLS